ncbi:hypothetical protein FW754_01715 [Acinetobacter sp. 1207_04]|uniref:hypothetical protein n=1 Tax=Acinetobacter sp. 1207_04 TaxID=2604449 RepID=UPI004058439C
MDIQTRLSLLDQHLALLIESTESCSSLTGESVAATLFIIQEQVRQIIHQDQLSTNHPKMTMAAQKRLQPQQEVVVK